RRCRPLRLSFHRPARRYCSSSEGLRKLVGKTLRLHPPRVRAAASTPTLRVLSATASARPFSANSCSCSNSFCDLGDCPRLPLFAGPAQAHVKVTCLERHRRSAERSAQERGRQPNYLPRRADDAVAVLELRLKPFWSRVC